MHQVLAAQTDSQAADDLILQYIPFIKSETRSVTGRFPADEDDELSIAMFAFYEAMMSYQADRGSFLGLASRAIRNRLIDFHRKEKRHLSNLSLDTPSSNDEDRTLGDRIADERNEIHERHDRQAAQAEIEHFSRQLEDFDLTLADIAENCPKQERTLSACMRVLDYARETRDLLDQMIRTKKLPISQLALGTGVEKKTMERHRKYLIAILLAYTNGFEIIRGHLRMLKRKEGTRS